MEIRLAGPYLHGLLTIHVILDDIKDCDGEEDIIHPRPMVYTSGWEGAERPGWA